MILSSSSIVYTIFGILLQFLVEVKSQMTFNPGLREFHTATLINDKLYILSGKIPGDIKSPKEKFLYLDVSVPFDTNELKWIDISNNDIVPPHTYASSIKGGANNNTLFLYSGLSISGKAMDLVYTFNAQYNVWSIPKTTGVPPNVDVGLTAVIDYNGLTYLFSNDMFVLDTINLSWKKVSSTNSRPRILYGAVFLPQNKSIIYMGGVDTVGSFSLNEVDLYDTVNDIWTTKTTTGLTPSARDDTLSSVLGLDGQRVIIFGGTSVYSSASSLYVLDINNFNWYIPKITGKIPSNRDSHKASLIGKYMVISFGNGYEQGVENDILLLDISNNDEYIWVTSFVPPVPSSSTPSSSPTPTSPTPPSSNPISSLSQSSSNNTGIIVGSVIGALIGGILLTIGSSFLYKRYKNIREQNRAVPTPGESNQYPQQIIQIPSDDQSRQTPPSQLQPIYNHGQRITPISGNTESLAQQNVDKNTLQNIIAQAVREEVDSRMARNFNQGSE